MMGQLAKLSQLKATSEESEVLDLTSDSLSEINNAENLKRSLGKIASTVDHSALMLDEVDELPSSFSM